MGSRGAAVWWGWGVTWECEEAAGIRVPKGTHTLAHALIHCADCSACSLPDPMASRLSVPWGQN